MRSGIEAKALLLGDSMSAAATEAEAPPPAASAALLRLLLALKIGDFGDGWFAGEEATGNCNRVSRKFAVKHLRVRLPLPLPPLFFISPVAYSSSFSFSSLSSVF